MNSLHNVLLDRAYLVSIREAADQVEAWQHEDAFRQMSDDSYFITGKVKQVRENLSYWRDELAFLGDCAAEVIWNRRA